MHVDSQHGAADNAATSAESSGRSTPRLNGIITPVNQKVKLTSSRDLLGPTDAQVPFKQRICPGMVVSWRHASPTPQGGEEPKLAVVLSSVNNLRPEFVTSQASERGIDSSRGGADGGSSNGGDVRFLCALVTPGLTTGAYEVNLWQQVSLDVESMEKEVFLDYDPGTRYYYISV